MEIKNRVKKLVHVRASKLLPSIWNWRTHPEKQREVLRDVLGEIGIAGAVVAREVSEGKYELIDGHLRQEELKAMGDQKVPVLVLDVTEEEAFKLLASYDPISALAQTDQEKFSALLKKFDTNSKPLASLFSEVGQFKKKELDLDISGDEDSEEPTAIANDTINRESHVRMVQLFLNGETQPIFEEMARELAEKMGTTNLTDTVFACLWNVTKNNTNWKKYVEKE